MLCTVELLGCNLHSLVLEGEACCHGQNGDSVLTSVATSMQVLSLTRTYCKWCSFASPGSSPGARANDVAGHLNVRLILTQNASGQVIKCVIN